MFLFVFIEGGFLQLQPVFSYILRPVTSQTRTSQTHILPILLIASQAGPTNTKPNLSIADFSL